MEDGARRDRVARIDPQAATIVTRRLGRLTDETLGFLSAAAVWAATPRSRRVPRSRGRRGSRHGRGGPTGRLIWPRRRETGSRSSTTRCGRERSDASGREERRSLHRRAADLIERTRPRTSSTSRITSTGRAHPTAAGAGGARGDVDRQSPAKRSRAPRRCSRSRPEASSRPITRHGSGRRGARVGSDAAGLYEDPAGGSARLDRSRRPALERRRSRARSASSRSNVATCRRPPPRSNGRSA